MPFWLWLIDVFFFSLIIFNALTICFLTVLILIFISSATSVFFLLNVTSLKNFACRRPHAVKNIVDDAFLVFLFRIVLFADIWLVMTEVNSIYFSWHLRLLKRSMHLFFTLAYKNCFTVSALIAANSRHTSSYAALTMSCASSSSAIYCKAK